MFLLLTGLTSQRTSFCNISNFRGWALISARTTAGCHAEWTGSAGEALGALCGAQGGQALNCRNLIKASNPQTHD